MIDNLFPTYTTSTEYSIVPVGPSITFKDIDSFFIKQTLKFIADGGIVIQDNNGNKLKVKLCI